jgi:hypothetical protein
MDREEELVYPTLACLPDIVNGRLGMDASVVVGAARRLKETLPQMLAEHRAVRDALEKLRSAAVSASRPTYERLADSLVDHFDTEEEVLYFAAILVGEFVALCLERERAKGAAGRGPSSQPGAVR